MTDPTPADSREAPPKPSPAETVPLTRVAVGQEVELCEVKGGRQLLHRLAEMGLTRGARFRILNRGRVGPIIICLKDTRLMLGRAMVHRMRVRPVEP